MFHWLPGPTSKQFWRASTPVYAFSVEIKDIISITIITVISHRRWQLGNTKHPYSVWSRQVIYCFVIRKIRETKLLLFDGHPIQSGYLKCYLLRQVTKRTTGASATQLNKSTFVMACPQNFASQKLVQTAFPSKKKKRKRRPALALRHQIYIQI